MSAQAAQDAKAQLAAAYCVSRFDAAPDASTKLAALQHTESWDRSDFIDKGGWANMPWVNMPWVKEPIEGVADLCAQKLISAASGRGEAVERHREVLTVGQALWSNLFPIAVTSNT